MKEIINRSCRITFWYINDINEKTDVDVTIGELIDDWFGECDLCPSNEDYVHEVAIQLYKKYDSEKYFFKLFGGYNNSISFKNLLSILILLTSK